MSWFPFSGRSPLLHAIERNVNKLLIAGVDADCDLCSGARGLIAHNCG